MAQSGLARLTGGQKVAGSNPVAPTFLSGMGTSLFGAFRRGRRGGGSLESWACM